MYCKTIGIDRGGRDPQNLSHNLKVTGSNPVPATRQASDLKEVFPRAVPKGTVFVFAGLATESASVIFSGPFSDDAHYRVKIGSRQTAFNVSVTNSIPIRLSPRRGY